VAVAPGDEFETGCSSEALAGCLLAAVTASDEAILRATRNATFSVSGGGSSKEEPHGAIGGLEALTPDEWFELLVPLDGPELWRSSKLRKSAEDTRMWVVDWADQWTDKSRAGLLTTKVRVRRTDGGVGIMFDPGSLLGYEGGMGVGKEGGVELVVDASRVVGEGSPRLRAKRFAYAPGAAVKKKSEDKIIDRLRGDFAFWTQSSQQNMGNGTGNGDDEDNN
jgi:hypothetical protein